jgi:flagellar hook-basal body complex protein FliE
MSLPISSLGSIPSVDKISLNRPAEPAGAGEFGNILKSAVQEVEKSHDSANTAIQSFLNGEDGELHSTILATQKAELQFDMFMQVRNKVVSAYQEIMRMQV